jgi:CBS domain-containing protein
MSFMRSGIRAIDIGDRKLITVKPSDKVVHAAKKMSKHRIGGIPVVRGDKLIGIITERDIINKVVTKNKHHRDILVKNVMTSPVKVKADKCDDLTFIAKKMSKHDVSRVPIVEGDKLVGFITNKDIAREAPSLLNVLLERIRMNDPNATFDPSAFGSCEICGEGGHLNFKAGQFLCELCSQNNSSPRK